MEEVDIDLFSTAMVFGNTKEKNTASERNFLTHTFFHCVCIHLEGVRRPLHSLEITQQPSSVFNLVEPGIPQPQTLLFHSCRTSFSTVTKPSIPRLLPPSFQQSQIFRCWGRAHVSVLNVCSGHQKKLSTVL